MYAFWIKWDAPKVYSFGSYLGLIYPRKTKNIAKNKNFCKKIHFSDYEMT